VTDKTNDSQKTEETMKAHVDEHGRLVMTVTKRERQSLNAAHRRCESFFDSDDFTHDLLTPLVTNDEYAWLPQGCTDDLTSAPMLGLLGEEMPGPDDKQDGMGLVHVGGWPHDGRFRQMYRPVLRRWAFMSYQVTSPQRELAERGECVWEGGDVWSDTKMAAAGLDD
jgi:hypothetical protein